MLGFDECTANEVGLASEMRTDGQDVLVPKGRMFLGLGQLKD